MYSEWIVGVLWVVFGRWWMKMSERGHWRDPGTWDGLLEVVVKMELC